MNSPELKRLQWKLYDKISGQFYAIMSNKEIDGAYVNGITIGKINVAKGLVGDTVVYGDLEFRFEGDYQTTGLNSITIKCCPGFNFVGKPSVDISELRTCIDMFLLKRNEWVEAERVKCIEECLEKYINA